MSVEEIGTHEDVQLEQLLKCSLPTSRVKKICRLDPDLSMIGGDAILFLTKATELFLTELAKASYTQAVLEKRKTIQTKDLDKAIASKHMFEFLDDTLNDWPEAETSETFLQAKNRIEKSTIEEEDVVDEDVAEFLDDDLEVATGEFGEGHGLENDDGGVVLSESVIASVDIIESSQAGSTD